LQNKKDEKINYKVVKKKYASKKKKKKIKKKKKYKSFKIFIKKL